MQVNRGGGSETMSAVTLLIDSDCSKINSVKEDA
jgi:hypothetical protein